MNVLSNIGIELSNSNPALKKNAILKIKDEKKRDRQIALWACTYGFDELKPISSPTPPTMLRERRKEQAKLRPGEYTVEDPSFWRETTVVDFLDKKWKANSKNKSNFEYLHWIKDALETTDVKYLIQIRNRLYEYTQFFDKDYKIEPPFKAFTINYGGKNVVEMQKTTNAV